MTQPGFAAPLANWRHRWYYCRMPPGNLLEIGWTPGWRLLAFLLSTTSLGCLLAQFYGICSMRIFAAAVFLPATAALVALCCLNLARARGRFCRPIAVGAAAGFIAAVAYDLFRLPFVYARQWGIDAFVPALNLFKVFPAFGAMLLGQPAGQAHYSAAASILGWIYHFSNGITIGVMYLALIGDPARRHWAWAVAVATGLELGMLLTPYPAVFGIPVTARFVCVTMGAHAVFGVCLGLVARGIWPPRAEG